MVGLHHIILQRKIASSDAASLANRYQHVIDDEQKSEEQKEEYTCKCMQHYAH